MQVLQQLVEEMVHTRGERGPRHYGDDIDLADAAAFGEVRSAFYALYDQLSALLRQPGA